MRLLQQVTTPPPVGGIRIESSDSRQANIARQDLDRFLSESGLHDAATGAGLTGASPGAHAWLRTAVADVIAPGYDTTGIAQRLGLRTDVDDGDLDREILLAMLASPIAFTFPDVAELKSAVRIRRYIVQAARKTALAFDTEHAERPEGVWT